MPYTGSLYQPNTALLEAFNDLAEVARVAQVHDVSTVRLDDVADIEQGAELDVFIGGEKALQTAVLIQTEVAFVEDYRGAPLFADIDSHLRSRGFWFHTFLGFGSRTLRPMRHGAPGDPGTGVDRGLNQKLWSDAVYIKHPLQREKLSTVKLQKLALLLHEFYKSYDFAYACLSSADARLGMQVAQRHGERLMRSDDAVKAD